MTARPIVKWAGGKTRLLPELLERVPRSFGTYFEPFAGGLALFFRLAPERAVLSDANEALMFAYATLVSFPEDVIAALAAHKEMHDETHYYATRDRWNNWPDTLTPVGGAAALLYLNKTCFNGLWRVNRRGEFNVPMGKYDDPPICDAENLRAAAAALARADLRCGDYRATVEEAVGGDFAYFDPPYDGTFSQYTRNGFGPDQQSELAAIARDLVERGVRVVLSNNDTPRVRELYEGFRIDVVKCGRAINSDGKKRGAVNEVLIVGGE